MPSNRQLADGQATRPPPRPAPRPGPGSFQGGGGTSYNTAPRPAPRPSQPAPRYGSADAAAARLDAGYIDPGVQAIMNQSGSTNPSDPYNWAGIAASLAAQQASAQPGPDTSWGPTAPPAPAPITPVYEAPAELPQVSTPVADPPQVFTPPPTPQPEVGPAMTKFGAPGTFGGFERLRSQRGPRGGMSVTPEMLRRVAARKLG